MATKKEIEAITKMINSCYDHDNPDYNDYMSPEQELGTYQDGLLAALHALTK